LLQGSPASPAGVSQQHDCYLFKVPATRTAFCLDQIAGNVARDARDRQQLAEQGWRVLIIWECALRGRLPLSA
ncbi:hypothetical protein ACLBWC_38580, partial [Pseudomonas aeruginosa]